MDIMSVFEESKLGKIDELTSCVQLCLNICKQYIGFIICQRLWKFSLNFWDLQSKVTAMLISNLEHVRMAVLSIENVFKNTMFHFVLP